MRFLIILKSNLKRMLKNKRNLAVSFLIPLTLTLALGYAFNKFSSSDNQSIIVNNDKGSYGSEFIKEYSKSNSIKEYSKEEGIEKLKKKQISVYYEIPENFTEEISKGEKPQIQAVKLESGGQSNFEFNANSIVTKMLLRENFEKSGQKVSLEDLSYNKSNIEVTGKNAKTTGDIVMLNMIISFVLFGAIGITIELLGLKKQNILSRSFTTSNTSKTIIGGVLVAMFVLATIGYGIVYLANLTINSLGDPSEAPVILINIAALSLVSLSLGVFVSRIIKNESMLQAVLQIVISVTCFIGGSFMPIEYLPKSITVFSKFTPQYWALQSINTGNAWLSIVVILFAVVLFTAGTFKVKNFVE
ncbi:ABC transporter permease [Clostridium sp. 'White wine YQ']|uniref:ABC transporter permease n=1 Tax=Clostridium sp. 'White wine YQ' TaxID=3027474 RepID=UPI002365CD49|nr:ABC transporter permease [Clostridium sp. 'White wine YQ']MDD7795292.1 ABC transporter permease [Clostridium sp. 'White wine YQ']